ncbi:AGAP009713-PA, partial [Anopheles gambiae str. PEST]
NVFAIRNATGALYLAKALDYEKIKKVTSWKFTIFAQDEGGEGLVGFTEGQINLKDVNDNAPLFPNGIAYGNVTENGTIGMHVMTIKAEDYDDINEGTNAKIIYSIEKNAIQEDTGLPIFDINPDTGLITTAVCCLDREKTPDYSLQIVIDNDDIDESDKYHVDHSWVIVKLKDINDNTPRFKKPHIEAAVYENADVGKNLGTFKAVDIDKGGKSKITYSFNRATDRKRQFAIDQEGTVTIHRELDREAMAKHSLEILATDDGVPPRTAFAILTVLVKDINDNAPVFAEDYRPILLENSPPSKIIEISAVDKDDRLEGNGDDVIRTFFKVEQSNKGDGMAIISSLGSFDREYRKQYTIPI